MPRPSKAQVVAGFSCMVFGSLNPTGEEFPGCGTKAGAGALELRSAQL